MSKIVTLEHENNIYDFVLTEEEEESLETYYNYINDDAYGEDITIELDDTIKNELNNTLITDNNDAYFLTKDISCTEISQSLCCPPFNSFNL